VLPDASVVQLGSPSGFAPGYNLVGAVVGSEGTLGIVTQATVRLEPIPERVETLLVSFPDVVTACRAVGGIIGAGLTPAALEIIDRRTIAAVEASVYAAGLPADAGAVLIVELDGAAIALPSQVDRVKQISRREGATQVEVAADESERQRFWRARKGAFGAMGRLAPDLYVHDAVVPRSRLPEVLDEICAIGDRYELTLSNVFHAGDGNLHPNISFDRRDPDVLERVIAAGSEILACCVRAGGVITGEHGVGNEKRDFLHLVTDSQPGAMAIIDDGGTYLWANRSLCENNGIAGDEIAADSDTITARPGASEHVLTIDLADPIELWGGRELLIWLDLSVAGQSVSSDLVTFARPKHLELPDPEVDVKVQTTEGDAFVVTLKAKRPALWAWLDLSAGDVHCSDNFLHLPPGQPVEVVVSPLKKTTAADLKKKLRVRSLVDTY